MEGIGEKSCRDRGETKPIVGFRKRKGSEDGHALHRRDCFGLRQSRGAASGKACLRPFDERSRRRCPKE